MSDIKRSDLRKRNHPHSHSVLERDGCHLEAVREVTDEEFDRLAREAGYFKLSEFSSVSDLAVNIAEYLMDHGLGGYGSDVILALVDGLDPEALASKWAAENGWTPPPTDDEPHGHPGTMRWCDVCGDVSDELESVDLEGLGWKATNDL